MPRRISVGKYDKQPQIPFGDDNKKNKQQKEQATAGNTQRQEEATADAGFFPVRLRSGSERIVKMGRDVAKGMAR
jgi:hypothetical protein